MSSDPPILIVCANDIFDFKKDHFCDLMIQHEWLPRVTLATKDKAKQIMLDHYEITAYDYLSEFDGQTTSDLKGSMRKECKTRFLDVLKSNRPDICLVIGLKLGIYVTGRSTISYGYADNIKVNVDGKLVKFFIIPSTRHHGTYSKNETERWFSKFLEFLDDEYN